jgi:pimeloyl-ACP methyl ester carboxylesterase
MTLKKTVLLFSFFIVVYAFAVQAFAAHAFADSPAQNTHCTVETQDKPFGYCVTKTEGSTNPDFVYYLHGAGLEQNAWTSSKEPIPAEWASQGLQAPTVITLGFGPIFLLAQKNQAKSSGLLEFVSDTYIPEIEKELGGLHGRRIALGESMGGFNAIQLAMKRPSMFAKIAINCPDIVDLSPYATKAEQQVFMDATGADATHTYWELYMERIFFANDGSWNDAAPLKAGPKYLGPETPPLFISGGSNDQYGFYPGTEAFAKIARINGVSVEWASVPGPHCSYDIGKVSAFLVN